VFKNLINTHLFLIVLKVVTPPIKAYLIIMSPVLLPEETSFEISSAFELEILCSFAKSLGEMPYSLM